MNKTKLNVVCFGEVLWDIFPTEKKIGGAPLNVASRLCSFGVDATIISSLGDDLDGSAALTYLKEQDIDVTNVQINKNYKTGCVNVILDNKGSATYEIENHVAWDFIELTERNIKDVQESDAFIFGSLACRNETTKNTLFQLLEYAKFRVFDVNLRLPFYTIELLIELMRKAHFIKCNDEEIYEITAALGCVDKSLEQRMLFLAKETNTKTICVTKGGEGALLLYNDQFFGNKGYQVTVADTVGAGDSFLASLVFKLLFKESPQESLDYASAIGSLVASKHGANPSIISNDIVEIRKNQG